MSDTRPDWMKRVEPLMGRFRELGARMSWEGYASLNTDHPRKKDIIIQHWYVPEGPRTRYYLVYIWADGSGWEVCSPITEGNSIKETLEAIT